jgi:hypothetical protein
VAETSEHAGDSAPNDQPAIDDRGSARGAARLAVDPPDLIDDDERREQIETAA